MSANVEANTRKRKLEEDPSLTKGRIVLRVDKFREIMQQNNGNSTRCSEEVKIGYIPWKLGFASAGRKTNGAKTFVVGLICNAYCMDFSCWSLNASLSLQIVTSGGGADKKLCETGHIFTRKDNRPILWTSSFQDVLDSTEGLYNADQDVVEFAVDIVAPPLRNGKIVCKETLLVNGQSIAVNKYLLAAHSTYFESLFFNENFVKTIEIKLDEPFAHVGYFQRMINTIPGNPCSELDDHCIEAVHHLSNRFLLSSVEDKCVEFLAQKSAKPALFKYRMAVKYSLKSLQEYVLENLKKDDFKCENFETNMREIGELGDGEAKEALMERYRQICYNRVSNKTPIQECWDRVR